MHTHMDVRAAVQRPEAQLDASGAQGSLITAIGGTSTAIGDSTAATGLIDNFVQNKGHISRLSWVKPPSSRQPTRPSRGMLWPLPAPSSTYRVPTSVGIVASLAAPHLSRIGSWEIWRRHVGKHQRILR
jgi:hypothetical protein